MSLFATILSADNSDIYEYEIRFKNKIGPFSIDGLKTFIKQDKSFKVIFEGENKILNARINQVSELLLQIQKFFQKIIINR